MTNADNGSILIGEVLATLADEYDWPAYRASQRGVAFRMYGFGAEKVRL